MRAPTHGGWVYFKAPAPGGAHEPGLMTLLGRRWPKRVPTPLGCDAERGWMLLPDRGPTLRDSLAGADGLQSWERLLPLYAEIQLASAEETETLLELGVPDRRLAGLPGLLEELLEDDVSLCMGLDGGLSPDERAAMRTLLPEFGERCHELDAMPNAAALEHGDLHEGNVLVDGDSYWLFDWGDSSVTHPFFSLLVTCNTQVDDFAGPQGQERIARLRDAYLEPFTEHTPAHSLRAIFRTALWVGHVGRALDWRHMLRGAGAGASEWQPSVARWLRRWMERRPLFRD